MRALELLLLGLSLRTAATEVTDKQYASIPEVFSLENFDQCMLLGDEALYCYFTYRLQPSNPGNISKTWEVIKEVNSNDMNYRHDLLRRWVCVPSSCPETASSNTTDDLGVIRDRIETCYKDRFKRHGLKGKVEDLKCQGSSSVYPIDWIDVLVGLLFVSYASFLLYATFHENIEEFMSGEKRVQNDSNNHKWNKILNSFSISRNWNRLKAVRKSEELERLKPYQGVRFYNTLIVILSHTALSMVSGPISNVKYVENMTEKVANLFLSSGPLCVSTFFAISTFFLVIGIYDSFKDKPLKIRHLVVIFVNRYIRLVPAYAAVVLFIATWWRHLGSGPIWSSIVGADYLRCRKNGWASLLFISNLVDKENMCLPHTWYLSIDSQYFIIVLLMIWYMKRHPRSVYPIIGFTLVATIVATFFENYINEYEALVMPRPESVYETKNILRNPQWHSQMAGLLGNYPGSLMGMFLGYRYLQDREKPPQKKEGLYNHIFYYIFSYGVGLTMTVMPGFVIFVLQPAKNPFWASVNVALGRPLFSMAIGYGVYQAVFNFGWPTRYVLRWFPVYMLARLSYSAYLVHVCIIMSRQAIQRYPVYISDIYLVYQYLADVTASYLIALLLTLSFELPISDLQKLLLQQKQTVNSKTAKKE